VQLVPLRHEYLALDQVDPGHDLGHRVLDLDPRVHLDEEELVAVEIDEELHGPRVPITGRRTQPLRGFADRNAQLLRQINRRRHLHDLLVAALHRAVPLPQVDEVAVRVPEDLHLDVLRPGDVPLNEHLAAAEGGAGLALGLLELPDQLRLLLDDAHPAAAAAEAGLEDQRVTDLLGGRLHLGRLGHAVLGPGDGRDVRLLGQPLGGRLVAERLEQLGRRADERDPVLLARPGQPGVLGQEPVPGVDRVHVVRLGRRR
jgi:hypothetical protein